MMKKTVLCILIICFLILGSSCSKNEVISPEVSPTPTDEIVINTTSSIAGQWKFDSRSYEGNDLYSIFGSSLREQGEALMLYEDGTFSIYIGAGYGGDGVYVYSGNQISASFKDYSEGNTDTFTGELVTENGIEYIVSTVRNIKLYWIKQSETISSPVPICTPIPVSTSTPEASYTSTPEIINIVPTVSITKNPTSETVTAGGKATFIAKAENYTKIVWILVSPDAKTIYYDINDALSVYPDIKITGQGSETLVIENIPKSLDGWRIQCYFEGAGGPAYTSGAYLKVTEKTNEASNLAKQFSTAVKKYADYSNWSMSEIENFSEDKDSNCEYFQLTLTRGKIKLLCKFKTIPDANNCYPLSIDLYESDILNKHYAFAEDDSEIWNHFEKTILDISDYYGNGTSGQSIQ